MRTETAHFEHLFLFSVLAGLCVVSFFHYLLFHTLAELFSIAVAWCVFMIAWNTRGIAQNTCLLILGIAYFWTSGLDLIHTLAYKGMAIFSAYDADLPTRLWIVARYQESLSLVAALLMAGRRIHPGKWFLFYGGVFILATAAIFGGLFPACYVEGKGLTPFKIVSEYIICLILSAAGGVLLKRRQLFAPSAFRLLAAAIALTIGAELAFTFYVSVYGLSNLIGHFFKLGSFYLIYLALVESGLRKPFSMMFRELKLYETMVTSVSDPISFVDRNYVYRMVNNAYESKVNRKPEDIIGLTVADLLGRDTFQKIVKPRLDRCFGGETVRYQTWIELPGGKRRFQDVGYFPIAGESGAVEGAVVNVRDMTEFKRAEAKLQQYAGHLEDMVAERTRNLEKAQAELIAKERLAVLGHFAGSVSHELRNPMAAIDASVFFLDMKFGHGNDKIREHIGRIRANVAQSTAIIESLLHLSRMEKPRASPTALADLIGGVLSTANMPDSVETVLALPDQPMIVHIEPEQMRMALKNIVQNAVQAMEGSGTLTISGDLPASGEATIAITDTGPGIAPEQMEKVFEPLFSTKTHGIGFGLSITKMIVENHGGTIQAEAPAEGGARFVITLPQTRPARF